MCGDNVPPLGQARHMVTCPSLQDARTRLHTLVTYGTRCLFPPEVWHTASEPTYESLYRERGKTNEMPAALSPPKGGGRRKAADMKAWRYVGSELETIALDVVVSTQPLRAMLAGDSTQNHLGRKYQEKEDQHSSLSAHLRAMGVSFSGYALSSLGVLHVEAKKVARRAIMTALPEEGSREYRRELRDRRGQQSYAYDIIAVGLMRSAGMWLDRAEAAVTARRSSGRRPPPARPRVRGAAVATVRGTAVAGHQGRAGAEHGVTRGGGANQDVGTTPGARAPNGEELGAGQFSPETVSVQNSSSP